jgi:hypothetical protein
MEAKEIKLSNRRKKINVECFFRGRSSFLKTTSFVAFDSGNDDDRDKVGSGHWQLFIATAELQLIFVLYKFESSKEEQKRIRNTVVSHILSSNDVLVTT